MIKYGSVVLQKSTLVNKVNYKDNKENRFSVVLFEFNLNNEKYVCSCPITNHKQTIKNFSRNFLYIPFQILTDTKYCSVKLDSVYFYPKKDIKPTGLDLNNDTVLKIYNSILNLEKDNLVLTSEQLNILKENIIKISKNIEKEQKRIKKENKKLKKQRTKELKRNYNNIK